ncbi:Uncharacterised protein [Actinobacillus pleuropneumoniae]|nr:Uncharacterised protein [Actinobacillus pleuropneumoniae]
MSFDLDKPTGGTVLRSACRPFLLVIRQIPPTKSVRSESYNTTVWSLLTLFKGPWFSSTPLQIGLLTLSHWELLTLFEESKCPAFLWDFFCNRIQ